MTAEQLNEQLDSGWKRESERLQIEFIGRLSKLRKDGVLRDARQLKDWLPRLNKALLAAFDFDEPRQSGSFHSRSKK